MEDKKQLPLIVLALLVVVLGWQVYISETQRVQIANLMDIVASIDAGMNQQDQRSRDRSLFSALHLCVPMRLSLRCLRWIIGDSGTCSQKCQYVWHFLKKALFSGIISDQSIFLRMVARHTTVILSLLPKAFVVKATQRHV